MREPRKRSVVDLANRALGELAVPVVSVLLALGIGSIIIAVAYAFRAGIRPRRAQSESRCA